MTTVPAFPSSPLPTFPEGPLCGDCPNRHNGRRRILPDGTGSSGIMIVGDSPWKQEILAGKVFAGSAGWYLNEKVLRRLGIDRPTLTIANSMWCQPPHLGWTDHPERYPESQRALNHCAPYLDELIEQRRPKVLVALGKVAMKRLLNTPPKTTLEQRHGYVHEGPWGIPTIASFHPSYLMQNHHKFCPSLLFSLRRAQEIASGTYRPTPLKLVTDPSPDEARRYLADHLVRHGGRFDLLLVDIETPESDKVDEEDLEEAGLSYEITRAGWSCCDNEGISFPFREPYTAILQEAINHAHTFAEWADNHFDSRRLRAASIDIPGRVLSGMWAWHFLQSDLLKGLGFVAPFYYSGPPWKHLSGINQPFYNACDQVIGRLCTTGAIQALRQEGRLDRFLRHCVDADRIYVRMGHEGVLIDRQQRGRYVKGEVYEGFMGTIGKDLDDLDARLQSTVPPNVKPIARWKKPPKDMTGVTEIERDSRVSAPEMDYKAAMAMVVAARNTVTEKEYKAARKRINDLKNPYKYMKVLPFNPESSDQVVDLMYALNLKPPRKKGAAEGDDDAETTEAKYLRRFAKKHRIFLDILEHRKRTKLITGYNWTLDAEGKVHYTIGYHPSTLRKSMRNYNLQVIPKRSDLADEFCKMIIAPPGHYIVSSDASAIEAVLVGYDAGSERYIKLAKAGLHGWTTLAYHGQFLPFDMPFDELRKLCKKAKRDYPLDYEVLKRVGHLSNYMGTPEKIWEEYPNEFRDVAHAKQLQDFIYSTEPGKEVRTWQHVKMMMAAEKRHLLNHFQYKHYFYSVFKWDNKKKMDVLDDDAKRAVAFVPQSDASAIQTEVVLRLVEGYDRLLDYLRLVVHDSIMMVVPERDVEYAATALHVEMTRPIPELPMKDGSLLSIGAETSCGQNFGRYDAETNAAGMREMQVVEEAA